MGNHLSEHAAELTSPILGSAGAVSGKAVLFTRQLLQELGEGTHRCLVAVPRDSHCEVDDRTFFQQSSAVDRPLRKHKQEFGSGDACTMEQPRASRAFALEALDSFDPELFRCPLQVGAGTPEVHEAKLSKACPAITATSAQECIGSLLHSPGKAASGVMLVASASYSDDLYSLTTSELSSLDDLWSNPDSSCSDGSDARNRIAKESDLVDFSQASVSEPGLDRACLPAELHQRMAWSVGDLVDMFSPYLGQWCVARVSSAPRKIEGTGGEVVLQFISEGVRSQRTLPRTDIQLAVFGTFTTAWPSASEGIGMHSYGRRWEAWASVLEIASSPDTYEAAGATSMSVQISNETMIESQARRAGVLAPPVLMT